MFKIVRQMTILMEFGNLHFSLKKRYFAIKLSNNIRHALAYHKNMSEIEFSTLAEFFFHIYGQEF